MLRFYRQLLRFYPASHRKAFSEEMLAVFGQLHSDAARNGLPRQLQFYVREGAGLLVGALGEHWREFLKRRFYMRDGFRFPKSTWILMTLILAGLVMAIAKGEAISVSLPAVNPALPPIHTPHELLSNWVLSVLIMYAVGVVVGGLLFALRRRSSVRLQKS